MYIYKIGTEMIYKEIETSLKRPKEASHASFSKIVRAHNKIGNNVSTPAPLHPHVLAYQ